MCRPLRRARGTGVKLEPPPAALVLMDAEVRALAAGAGLVVGEPPRQRASATLDRAATLPLPISLIRGVVNAVDLL